MANITHTHLSAKTFATSREALVRLLEKAPTLLELFWIFVIASVVGLVAEVITSFFIDGRWESRAGLVWGPFSPIYGAGAMLITMLLWPLKDKPAALFLGSAFVGAAFEYLAGWFWETYYGIVAWSYVDQPFNLDGHTCLGMAVVWGIAGVLWFRAAYPAIQTGIKSVHTVPRRVITTVLTVFLILDIAMTFLAFGCWFDRQAGLPVETPQQQFCATYFNDEFMATRFETMSMWTCLAYNR